MLSRFHLIPEWMDGQTELLYQYHVLKRYKNRCSGINHAQLLKLMRLKLSALSCS